MSGSGGTHFARRVSCSLALAGLLSWAGVSAVAADPGDELTPWGHDEWSPGAEVNYTFDNNVPPWLRDVVRDILEATYPDSATNNSNAPRYAEATPAQVTIYEPLGANAPLFCPTDWLGCTTTDAPNSIWIRQDPATGYGGKDWCHVDDVGGCIDVGRVIIHEVGHMSGYLNHYGDGTAYGRTRMTALPPKKNQAPQTYTSRVLGRCDEARLQKEYGVASYWLGFRECWDEVANTETDGDLKSKVTASPNYTSVCSGETISLSGRLSIDEFTSYGEVSLSNLANRVVEVHRNGVFYVSAITDGTGADNWSKYLTFTVATTTSYTFQARFLFDETAVGHDSSGMHTLTWIKDPLLGC